MADEIELITSVQGLESAIDEMLAAPRYSLDVESDGFHSYAGRVCIVTLSTEHRDVVIDTLALGRETSRLQRLVASAHKPCLMHSGHNDVLALKREYEMPFGFVQDTSVASMLLGFTHTGLSALCETFLGFTLEKELQRHDWARRPMLPEHVSYLVNDTRHLFKLHDLITAELAKHGLSDEYEIECRAVAESEPIEREFDPERFRKIKGALDINDEGRGILRALYMWRNETAKSLDRAAFRVASDSTLLEIARTRPTGLDDLSRLRGVGEWLLNQAGDAILSAVSHGQKNPAPLRGPHRPRHDDTGTRMDPRQRDRLGRLKKWREQEAQKRGLGLQAILPTSVLHDLVLQPPADAAALAAVPRVGPSRAQRYGDQILRIVRGRQQ
ncbi:MAG: HRDC domain-containing protein [Planctomycetes bacterium]|nr:HRDC domain-containing protein [Planctomycetota bacterium]